MSNNTSTPDAKPWQDMADSCINIRMIDRSNSLDLAKMFRAQGDALARAGDIRQAAKWHARSLEKMAIAGRLAAEIIELAEDFDRPLPSDLDTSDRWMVAECKCAKSTVHRGCGEGDSGLPDGGGDGEGPYGVRPLVIAGREEPSEGDEGPPVGGRGADGF